jgi:hypothetical protein
MNEMEPLDSSVEKSRAVERWLVRIGGTDRDTVGRLCADLGDLYEGAAEYRRLLDELLAMPTDDSDRLGQAIIDLRGELRHLAYHIRSGVRALEQLADQVNGEATEDEAKLPAASSASV